MIGGPAGAACWAAEVPKPNPVVGTGCCEFVPKLPNPNPVGVGVVVATPKRLGALDVGAADALKLKFVEGVVEGLAPKLTPFEAAGAVEVPPKLKLLGADGAPVVPPKLKPEEAAGVEPKLNPVYSRNSL